MAQWKDLGLHIPKIEVPLKSKSDQLLEKLEGAGLGEFELEKIISDQTDELALGMLRGLRAQMLGIDLDKKSKIKKADSFPSLTLCPELIPKHDDVLKWKVIQDV